jgi:diguanylate cyclase (GGDEF)-like protein/PAS domain S-box-containing protein
MEDRKKNKEQLVMELAKLREKNAAMHHIMTGMEKTEKELRDSVERYSALIESTDDSIYLVDKKSRYLFINKKHLHRMALRADEVLGKSYGAFHSPDETREFVHQIQNVLQTGESSQHEHRSTRDGGYFLRTLSPVMNSTGKIKAVTVISKNITPLKMLEAKLYALSLYDELTQLYNRRGFMTLADQQIKISKRKKRPLLLIFADVNNFKMINDTYGHAEGDIALRELAAILKQTFRESDIITRMGGDEFVILITSFRSGKESLYLRRLNHNVERFNRSGTRPYVLSISTGVVVFDPATFCSIDELLKDADRSMYERKRAAQKDRT